LFLQFHSLASGELENAPWSQRFLGILSRRFSLNVGLRVANILRSWCEFEINSNDRGWNWSKFWFTQRIRGHRFGSAHRNIRRNQRIWLMAASFKLKISWKQQYVAGCSNLTCSNSQSSLFYSTSQSNLIRFLFVLHSNKMSTNGQFWNTLRLQRKLWLSRALYTENTRKVRLAVYCFRHHLPFLCFYIVNFQVIFTSISTLVVLMMTFSVLSPFVQCRPLTTGYFIVKW